MNAWRFITALLLSTAAACPQGQLILDNRVGGVLVAPIYGPVASDPELSLQGNTATGFPAGSQIYTGAFLAGRDYSAQLFAGNTNTPADQLQPVLPIVHFRAGTLAGFWVAPDLAVTIPGVPEGTAAKVQLRAWYNDGNRFPDWNTVRTNGWTARGVSLPFITPPLGRLTVLPPNLVGLRSFNISIPAGVAALLPPAPDGLEAESTGDTSIRLSWQVPPGTVTGYRIEHSLDGLVFPDGSFLSANAASHEVPGLRPGIRHYFRIRSVNAAGESPPSNVAVAATRTPFAQWRFTHFSAADATNDVLSGPSADPDQDGHRNFVEYTFDANPHSSDRPGLITSFIDRSVHPAGVLAVTYSRNARASEAVVQARTFSEIDEIPTGSGNVLSPVVVSQTVTQITERIRDDVAVTPGSHRGMRLEVVDVGLRDAWQTLPDLPVALEGAAGAVIGGQLYVVGGGNNATLRYDFSAMQWTILSGTRPFPSGYHSAEVIDDKMYLIGGLSGPAAGKVQIYDPVVNGWTLGPPVPYPFGWCASAVIHQELFVTAPDPANPLKNFLARYTPSNQRWTTNLLGLPQARLRAASGTDGSNLFVIGGRDPGVPTSDGSDTVQIYNPVLFAWSSSAEATSALSPLPEARTGLGKAIFRNGQFYVLGGETRFGFGATASGTYNRVDIYHVAANQWTKGTPMLTARHGYAAVLHEGRIYVAAGGTIAGSSASTAFEVYSP